MLQYFHNCFGHFWYQTFPQSWGDSGERPAQVNRAAKTSGSEETRWTPLVVQVKGPTCVILSIDLSNLNRNDPFFCYSAKSDRAVSLICLWQVM